MTDVAAPHNRWRYTQGSATIAPYPAKGRPEPALSAPSTPAFYAPFEFIVSLLDRLSFRWKFATVAVVFVVAAAGFLHQIYAHYRAQAVLAERAIGGLGLVRDSLALMIELQLERGVTFTARKGGDDFTARVPQQKAAVRSGIERVEAALERRDSLTALHPRWASVRADIERAIHSTEDQSSAQSSFDTHTAAVNELLAWIVDIGDEAGITATSNPALYHLNLAQIRSLPGLVESLANLRGYATGTFLAGRRDAGITFELAAQQLSHECPCGARTSRCHPVCQKYHALQHPPFSCPRRGHRPFRRRHAGHRRGHTTLSQSSVPLFSGHDRSRPGGRAK